MSSLKKLIFKNLQNKIKNREVVSKSNKPVSFYPSIVSSPCLRKIYYAATNASKKEIITEEKQLLLDLGTEIGEMISENLREVGALIDYKLPSGEFKINKRTGKEDREFPAQEESLNYYGKIDAVFTINNKLYLGEFKSSNSFSFSKLKDAKPEHKEQAASYLYIFNKNLKNGEYKHIPELSEFDKAEGIFIIYFNKNDSKLKEFYYSDLSDSFKNLVFKIAEVKASIQKDILPEPTEDWCNSCPYLHLCKKSLKK